MYIAEPTVWGVHIQVCLYIPWLSYCSAKEILDHFRDQFIDDIVANDVVMELLHEGIISEGVKDEITRNTERVQQNQILHLELKQRCNEGAFKAACEIISKVEGNPRMSDLGTKMKKRLETGTC